MGLPVDVGLTLEESERGGARYHGVGEAQDSTEAFRVGEPSREHLVILVREMVAHREIYFW